MKQFPAQQSRDEYLRTQVQRSDAKFDYCKVSAGDVRRYADVLHLRQRRAKRPQPIGPVVCLGTRNGREVDIFRTQLFAPHWRQRLMRALERDRKSFTAGVPMLEAIGRSRLDALDEHSVVGVELNPRAARRDIWVGSFDAMPAVWTDTFGVVFSNSFDQSQDPARSAAEWLRVIRPGGYLIFCFANDAAPTETDPIGGLSLPDARDLFGGELVYFQDRGSRAGYSEVILRINKGAA